MCKNYENKNYHKKPEKLNRRYFIKSAALGAGALTFSGAKIFAGPFDSSQSDFLIPTARSG